MFQSLSNLVSLDNRATQIFLGAVVVVVLFGVVIALYRLIFAHRLRVPGGGRGRAPRLGVVDVFSLDAQRQLVIVRRDNVEHLLMIGGPNDLVVEPQILRGAANGANSREFGKPAAPVEPAMEAAPRPIAPAASSRRSPFRSATPATEPPPLAAAAAVEPSPIASEPPAADPHVRYAPPARGEAPAKPPEPAAPPPRLAEPLAAAEPKPAAENLPPRKPLAPLKPVTIAPRPNLPSPITPSRSRNLEPAPAVEPPKPVAVVDPAKAPDVVIVPPSPELSASAPAVIVPPANPAAAPDKPPRTRAEDSFYDLESLEAEMARLLGRDG